MERYNIEEAISMLRKDPSLVFEIRDKGDKCSFSEHMFLICVKGITGNLGLQFFTKPKESVTPYIWKLENYIPFSDKIGWYISQQTKFDIQKSIDEIGIKN